MIYATHSYWLVAAESIDATNPSQLNIIFVQLNVIAITRRRRREERRRRKNKMEQLQLQGLRPLAINFLKMFSEYPKSTDKTELWITSFDKLIDAFKSFTQACVWVDCKQYLECDGGDRLWKQRFLEMCKEHFSQFGVQFRARANHRPHQFLGVRISLPPQHPQESPFTTITYLNMFWCKFNRRNSGKLPQ